jgi:HK97 family phage major capsid protein
MEHKMNLSETLAAMDALVTDEMTDEAQAQFKAYEADVVRFQETDRAREKMADLRKPITGFPAVIRASKVSDEDQSFDQFLRTGRAEYYALNKTTTTEGAFTVPDTFRNKLIEARARYGGFGELAENISTATGAPLAWPTTTVTTSSQADIAAEGAATAAGADLVFGEVALGAYKYVASGTGNIPMKVSIELLQDSMFDVGALVAKKLGERIARKQAYDLVLASGSGAPLGIMYGTAQDESTASGSVPTLAKLNALVHDLDPEYRQGASWIMCDAEIEVIESIVDTHGRPILVNNTMGIADSIARPTLLGFPLHTVQEVPVLSDTVLGIGFGNWQEAYVVRHVLDTQILVNPYAAVGYVVYDAWARMDGTIQNYAAYVTMEGTT